QLGRRGLQRVLDGRHDVVQRVGQRFEDFVGGDRERARHAFGQVAALDLDLLDLAAGEGRADGLLDRFGGGLADQHAVVAADVADDRFVELVAAHAHAALVDHAAQGDHADFGGAAADVDHHGAAGFGDGKARTDRGGHGFFDQVDLGGAGAQRRFADGAALDLRGAAGDADDDARAGPEDGPRMDHLDELLEHLLRHRE